MGSGRQAVTMQYALGSVRVARVADGVAPSAARPRFGLAVRCVRFVQRSWRRDYANDTPEACAPQLPLRG